MLLLGLWSASNSTLSFQVPKLASPLVFLNPISGAFPFLVMIFSTLLLSLRNLTLLTNSIIFHSEPMLFTLRSSALGQETHYGAHGLTSLYSWPLESALSPPLQLASAGRLHFLKEIELLSSHLVYEPTVTFWCLQGQVCPSHLRASLIFSPSKGTLTHVPF